MIQAMQTMTLWQTTTLGWQEVVQGGCVQACGEPL